MDVSNFRLLISFFLLMTFAVQHGSEAANFGSYFYEQEFYSMGLDYLDLLDSLPDDDINKLSPAQVASCHNRYGGILKDGVLDIRIALGYFDWSTGSDVASFGLSPSMDPGAFAALQDLLTSPCSLKLRFCGFKQDPQDPSFFLKTVSIFGQKYLVKLEMRNSSVTEYFSKNTGDHKVQQLQQSAFMDDYFRRALQESDATFYFGHSRNGGGPDFSPPHLNTLKKVDYDGYYSVYKPGLKSLLTALGNSSQQTKILGLMSCDSRTHFLSPIRKLSPTMGLITSMDVVDVEQVYTAMIGAIDALLRGQCQQTFYRELRMTEKNHDFITMDGMFETLPKANQSVLHFGIFF